MNNSLDKRAYSKVIIGDYYLVPDTFVAFLVASRIDGTPVPKPLSGKWLDMDAFRKAAEVHHGEEYSSAALRERAKLEAAAKADALISG